MRRKVSHSFFLGFLQPLSHKKTTPHKEQQQNSAGNQQLSGLCRGGESEVNQIISLHYLARGYKNYCTLEILIMFIIESLNRQNINLKRKRDYRDT